MCSYLIICQWPKHALNLIIWSCISSPFYDLYKHVKEIIISVHLLPLTHSLDPFPPLFTEIFTSPLLLINFHFSGQFYAHIYIYTLNMIIYSPFFYVACFISSLNIFSMYLFYYYYFNHERCSSTCQVLELLYRNHQFKFYKPHGHWKFTWSLTSELVKLIKVHVN
jgi:hypothetical protein